MFNALSVDTYCGCGNQNTVNYSLVAGDKIVSPVLFLDATGDETLPIDLTGWGARMTIEFNDTPVEFTTDNGFLEILSPKTGLVVIDCPSGTTINFTSGVYSYDFWLIPFNSPLNESQYYTGLFTVLDALPVAS